MIVRDDAALRILLFVSLLQSFAYFVPIATWNPTSRLGLTSAIVERGRLDVGRYAQATGDRARRDGRWYSDKAPFPSFFAVPAYALVRSVHRALGRPAPDFDVEDVRGVVAARLKPSITFSQLLYASSFATAGLAGAVLGMLLFTFLRRRFTATHALVASVSVMLGTPLLPYATSFYGHVPAALALFGALYALDDATQRDAVLAVQGALLAFAVGCEYLSAVPATVIALFSLARAGRRAPRAAFLLVLGAFPCALALGLYHQACFGSPFRTGYSFVVDPVFVEGHALGLLGLRTPHPEALAGLLFGERRGLFRLAPITLLGVIGLVAFLRAHRGDRSVWAGALALLALLLANASYYMWWGGAATGPRHLVPVLPVLAVGVAHLASLGGRAFGLVLFFALLSIGLSMGLTFVGLEVREQGDAIFDYLIPSLVEGQVGLRRGGTNLGALLGYPRAGSFGPLLAFWILSGYVLLTYAKREDEAGAQRPELVASGAAS